jgi:molybdopterin converting factor small subunit
MTHMRVLYFAGAADCAGCREESWEITSGLSLDDFWHEVLQRHPELRGIWNGCRVASGGRYVGAGEMIDPELEAAVIPPVSGG